MKPSAQLPQAWEDYPCPEPPFSGMFAPIYGVQPTDRDARTGSYAGRVSADSPKLDVDKNPRNRSNSIAAGRGGTTDDHGAMPVQQWDRTDAAALCCPVVLME